MVRIRTGAVCALALLGLSACGGGSGGSSPRPPITLKGASYAIPAGQLAGAGLRSTEGGAGPNIGGVIYVDDGVFEFLGDQARRLDANTIEFRAGDGSIALVSALPGYEDTRIIRQQFSQNGTSYISEGIIGRFTSDDRMASTSGSATYIGAGTAVVQGRRSIGDAFNLAGPQSLVHVDVNFETRRVSTTLDFTQTAGAVDAPIDTVIIDGMRISGNRFSGGSLTSLKTGVGIVTSFSVPARDLSSSGVFAGWRDATGAVRDRNVPAEVGGAFVADAGVNTLTGYYLAD